MQTRGQVSNGEAVKGDKVSVVINGSVAWTGRIEYFKWSPYLSEKMGWVGLREGRRVDEVRAELVERN